MDQIAKVTYKYTFSLANAIKKRGIDIHIVIDMKQEEEDCLCPKIRLFNTDEKNIGKLRKVVNYICSMHKVTCMMDNYDILHTQWVIFSPMDYLFFRGIKRKNKKIIITIHDILPFNQKFYDYYFHKKIYGLADQIIVQTNDNIKRFHTLFPENNCPVSMIPHGHFMDYAKLTDKEKAREKYNIDKNDFIYLFFGQIKRVKGVDVLLNAYAILLNQHPEIRGKVKLVIAGSIWKTDYSYCREIIQRKGIEKEVIQDIRFIPDTEVDDYYALADIAVLPYKEVYQSGVLQLTYAHQRAAIVTRIPAFTDIVNDERGFICEPSDARNLSEKLYEAYSNRDQLERMAAQGYNYIKEKYNWDDIAQKVVAVYRG